MRVKLKSITPVRPNDVGDTRYEFRVAIALGERDEQVDVTAEQLIDFRQFQQIALAKTGCFPNLGMTDAGSEFEAYRRWQIALDGASWDREAERNFENIAGGNVDDDSDVPTYGLADDE